MPDCQRCGAYCKKTLCRHCQKGWNFCSCGKVKKRNVAQCKECRPTKPSPPVCPKCGGPVYSKHSKLCRPCSNYRKWTQHDDDFIRQYYPTRGAEWCALKLGCSVDKMRVRASMLKVPLSKKTYRKLVHGAASQANRGRKHTPEQREANRQRCLDNIDLHKAHLLKGRLANQKANPSGLEQKLWQILTELGTTFESQVIIKKSLIVDVRIGNIIIEADGDWWHGHPRFEPLTQAQLKQQRRDRAKQTYLESCGYTVIRIWESDMSTETVRAALQMEQALIQPTFEFL